MYTCIGTLAFANPETRRVEVVLLDGDQWTENYALKVPEEFPMPVRVEDGDFLDKHGRLPKTIELCHIKIGYEYAYDVRRYHGDFKLHGAVYLGEVRARSCNSMNGLKRKKRV